PVKHLTPVRRLHVFVIRHPAFDFAAQGDSAFSSKSQFECPIDNRSCASLDSDLVKPSVARFGQRLDEIQRSAIFLFPVVKSDVADFDSGNAFVEVVRCDRAAFQSGNTYRNLESRPGRISGSKGARQKRNVRVILQRFEFFGRYRWDENIRIVRWPGGQGQDVPRFWLDDYDCTTFC